MVLVPARSMFARADGKSRCQKPVLVEGQVEVGAVGLGVLAVVLGQNQAQQLGCLELVQRGCAP